jgi:hypothetical protein
MQRTLIELDYLPVGYIPAMVFDNIERLDVVKMVRLFVTDDFYELHLHPSAKKIAHLVISSLEKQKLFPVIGNTLGEVPIFADLTKEQQQRLAQICCIEKFLSHQIVFKQGSVSSKLYIVLSGKVSIAINDQTVGHAAGGEILGEMALLDSTSHSATVKAENDVILLSIQHGEFESLVRQRPDIGLQIYRKMAYGLGKKLQRLDLKII